MISLTICDKVKGLHYDSILKSAVLLEQFDLIVVDENVQNMLQLFSNIFPPSAHLGWDYLEGTLNGNLLQLNDADKVILILNPLTSQNKTAEKVTI